jgi:3-deoxy-7-phosphoheptulonate synthase
MTDPGPQSLIPSSRALGAWSPTSWKAKPAAQCVVYQCPEEVDRIVEQISRLPPLVTSWEVLDLKSQLADATRGERFLLQGGD